MITRLLDKEVREFILSHLQAEPANLLLQAQRFPHLPMKEIVDQIIARQKATAKWPKWSEKEDLIFPPPLSVEQSSSEITARFKAGLVNYETFADLTGGAGIDFLALAENAKKGYYIEQNPMLCEMAAHNFPILCPIPFHITHGDAEDFLASIDKIDLIFVDPARRDVEKKKVFKWEDLSPNIIALMPLLLQKADSVLVKGSPMVDIKSSILEFQHHISDVWVVGLDKEVKEVLLLLKPEKTVAPNIHAVDLFTSGNPLTFDFTYAEEQNQAVNLSAPKVGDYLFEPSAAVLKSGAFKTFAQKFGLKKIHPHSHLYLHSNPIDFFQGRVFEIEAISGVQKKELQKHLPNLKANLSQRNFPMDIAVLKKKLGIKDGGDHYVFATTTLEEKKILIIGKKLA